MGMFDHVNYIGRCPCCDSEVTDFQTKSGACELKVLHPHEVAEFYTRCSSCGARVTYVRERIENFYAQVYDVEGSPVDNTQPEVYAKVRILISDAPVRNTWAGEH